MKHLMIDLETLGTSDNARILTIGAVMFDDENIISEMEFVPDEQGGEIDISTVQWWMGQDDAARRTVTRKHSMEDSMKEAGFLEWLDTADTLWGNGATFDLVILKNYLKRQGRTVAWPYKKERCFRTLRDTGNRLYVPEPVFMGTRHSALADARHQAAWALKIFAALRR